MDMGKTTGNFSHLLFSGDFLGRLGLFCGKPISRVYQKILEVATGRFPDVGVLLDMSTDKLVKKLNGFAFIRNLTKAPHYDDEPLIHVYTSGVAGYPYLRVSGKSFFRETDAALSAFFEAGERYGYRGFLPDNFIRLSSNEVGGDSLDVFSLAGFSDEQKAKNKILAFDENTKFGLTPADCLTRGRSALIPLQLASSRYLMNAVGFQKKYPGKTYLEFREPLLRWPVTTGVAAGLSKDWVIYNGIMECIERDAFMITYLNKLSPPVLNLRKLDLNLGGRHIVDYFNDYKLDIYAVRLLSDLPVHIVAALIIDRGGRGPALSIGASAHHGLIPAVYKAFAEALSSRISNRVLGLHKASQSPGRAGKRSRLTYWSKLENLEKIDFLTRGSEESKDMKFEIENSNLSLAARVSILIGAFRKMGHEVYYVNLVPPELKKYRFEIGKIIIPGLQPMHFNETFPYLGGERLKAVPEKLGYKPARSLNGDPHPFH